MIQRIDTKIQSKQDGLELGVTVLIPEQPKGILQIVHGMAEHRRRYEDFMRYMAEQGYVTVIHDHRGHGDSVKNAEDLGYFYEDGAKSLVADAYQVTEYIKAQFPGLPLVLFGHSMGSMVVRCYMKQHDAAVNGLIVCGSPSKRVGIRAAVALVKLMGMFKGDHHRSELIGGAFNQNFKKYFPDEASVNSWIASDPAVVAAYDADERSGFTFTLNGFEALFTLSAETYSKRGWQRQNLSVPIFFIAGADDPCIINAKAFNQAVDFMRKIGYTDVKSKLYPGMRHEILNEKGKQEVWQNIAEFCNQVTAVRA